LLTDYTGCVNVVMTTGRACCVIIPYDFGPGSEIQKCFEIG